MRLALPAVDRRQNRRPHETKRNENDRANSFLAFDTDVIRHRGHPIVETTSPEVVQENSEMCIECNDIPTIGGRLRTMSSLRASLRRRLKDHFSQRPRPSSARGLRPDLTGSIRSEYGEEKESGA
jgi:hypothetical protein